MTSPRLNRKLCRTIANNARMEAHIRMVRDWDMKFVGWVDQHGVFFSRVEDSLIGVMRKQIGHGLDLFERRVIIHIIQQERSK